MWMKQFTLIEKKALTDDVFELHFSCNEEFTILAGQFVTFILPQVWGRAYSILSQESDKTVLLIKRVKEEYGWRGGSIMICDTQEWEVLQWVWPAGHFVLKEEDNAKLFIWTGTWLVPLYNQILVWLERGDTSEYSLVFGVRTVQDLFYIEEIKQIAEKYKNFSYSLYLSREESEISTKGYVTDFLSKENIKRYSEFYICGGPVMVDDVVEKLENWSVQEEKIFTEKY